MEVDPNDWRLSNGGDYLEGLEFSLRQYTANRADSDHDHCELCMVKFVESPEPGSEDLGEGYATQDSYRWVCASCFGVFKDHYQWRASA
jgi:hypothetical protein